MRSNKPPTRSYRGERPTRQNGLETRDRILDAAEILFARDGYGATSLRAVAREAGANQASIHYHFPGKLELFVAVYQRHTAPLEEAKLRGLQALIDDGLEKDVGALGRALFGPVVRSIRTELAPGIPLSLLFWRFFSEPGAHWDEALRQDQEEAQVRFVEAFASALPELPQDELLERLDFCQGAVLHLCADKSKSAINSPWQNHRRDSERFERRIASIVRSVLIAPSTRNSDA